MGKNRNKKGLRKYRIRLLILVIFLIVVSVFLYMANRDRYPHPDLLPEGSEAENLLHDITFAGGVKFPEQREAMIYCNKVDQKESLRRAARCLGLEVSDFLSGKIRR